ncbi:hypothetical protein ACPV4B_16530 [Vibrio parahaemolyticus]
MYGSEKTKAFCCNCKQLTHHKYTMFATKKETSPRKEGFLTRILSALASSEATGDYKCQRCGTYLSSPDYLD